ncbi:hypothetical protein DLAC_06015 [Tieghemostelium lacteum]|uniref:DUF885 domain-containing protein n=1 Tax=Tieghemostelium lacteum TaxID=361077 RepID=A0A151ZHK6_TIELA|nr:hypothetical protein DLAC_06015 [Tieghemostelium lacteum]|eukprot:KYQ93344.1 hypothetical protein DLAC_06015 [Tieghemostelium lacteum]
MFRKVLVRNGAVDFLKKCVMSGAMVTAGAITFGVASKVIPGGLEPKYLALTLAGVESVVFYVSWKIFYGVPFTFKMFSTRALLDLIADQYFIGSQLRVLDRFGFSFQHGTCDILSFEQRDKQLDIIQGNLRVLKHLESKVQPGSPDHIGWMTMNLYFKNLEQAYEFQAWPSPLYFIYPTVYPLNQLFGYHIGLLDILTKQTINNENDIREFIQRIKGSTEFCNELLVDLNLREKLEEVPPPYVIEGVMKQIHTRVLTKFENTPEDYFLNKKLQLDMTNLKLSQKTMDRYIKDLNTAVDQHLIPGFTKIHKYLDDLKPTSKPGDGIWRLPNGEELYKYLLKFHTTIDITAEEIHEIGLKHIQRLRNEVISLFKDEYPDVERNFSQTLRAITKEERFQMGPEGDPKTKDTIIKEYKKIIDDVIPKLGEFFEKVPLAKCDVEAVPSYKENESPTAYYMPAPLDRSKPGVFYANLRDTPAHNRVIMKDLCYHEAIPGHHYQIALGQEEQSIDVFRRNMVFTAYTEGWGLYVERFASEAGWYSDKYERLGHLNGELWRAVRLVVDTGLHSSKFKWTKQQAIDLMNDNTALGDADVLAEVERYIVCPGQAVSYYIGLLKIAELREMAKSKLSDKFSLKEYHSVVLNSGAIPLSVLEIVVNNWVNDKLKK